MEELENKLNNNFEDFKERLLEVSNEVDNININSLIADEEALTNIETEEDLEETIGNASNDFLSDVESVFSTLENRELFIPYKEYCDLYIDYKSEEAKSKEDAASMWEEFTGSDIESNFFSNIDLEDYAELFDDEEELEEAIDEEDVDLIPEKILQEIVIDYINKQSSNYDTEDVDNYLYDNYKKDIENFYSKWIDDFEEIVSEKLEDIASSYASEINKVSSKSSNSGYIKVGGKKVRFSDHTNTSGWYDKPNFNFSLDLD